MHYRLNRDQSSKENILELIKAHNSNFATITAEQFELFSASTIPPTTVRVTYADGSPAKDINVNSKMVIRGIPTRGLQGEVEFKYLRISLSDLSVSSITGYKSHPAGYSGSALPASDLPNEANANSINSLKSLIDAKASSTNVSRITALTNWMAERLGLPNDAIAVNTCEFVNHAGVNYAKVTVVPNTSTGGDFLCEHEVIFIFK